MKFKHLINKSKETRRKYEYYLGLGYSDKAAKVLSVVTYGNEKLVVLVSFTRRSTPALHTKRSGGSDVHAPVYVCRAALPGAVLPEDLRRRKQPLRSRLRKT